MARSWKAIFQRVSTKVNTSDIRQLLSDFFFYCIESIKQNRIEYLIDRLFIKAYRFSRKSPFIRYIKKFLSTIIEAAILMIATWGLCVLLLYVTNMLWQLYLETWMGQDLLVLMPERAQTIIDVSKLNFWRFSAELTITAFLICICISAVGQFFHINRHLYFSQGFLGKVLIWGTALTAAVTYYFFTEYDYSDWRVIAAIVSIPTYCMFTSCFKYSEKLLPECGDCLRASVSLIKKTKQMIMSFLMPYL